jgi:modulator of FtsH protease
MSFDLPSSNNGELNGALVSSAQRNQVLRQTYLLLAASMIPTIIGAALGVYMGLGQLMRGSPFIGMAVLFAGAFGLMYMVQKNSHSSAGVGWLMGFTFFMGLMLSQILSRTLGFKNGPEMIMLAFGGTAAIFGAMATIAGMIKRDLSGLGKFLMIGAVVLMVASIGAVFLKIPAFSLFIIVGVLILFSVYLMYDLNQIMQGGETNYISATLSVYLDVYNIFSSLLALIGIGGSKE